MLKWLKSRYNQSVYPYWRNFETLGALVQLKSPAKLVHHDLRPRDFKDQMAKGPSNQSDNPGWRNFEILGF